MALFQVLRKAVGRQAGPRCRLDYVSAFNAHQRRTDRSRLQLRAIKPLLLEIQQSQLFSPFPQAVPRPWHSGRQLVRFFPLLPGMASLTQRFRLGYSILPPTLLLSLPPLRKAVMILLTCRNARTHNHILPLATLLWPASFARCFCRRD